MSGLDGQVSLNEIIILLFLLRLVQMQRTSVGKPAINTANPAQNSCKQVRCIFCLSSNILLRKEDRVYDKAKRVI